jgi:SAM-dependent methyltransferase
LARADRERWDRKYAAGNPNPEFEPDPILVSHASLLNGPGLALDVACGVGHNALYLARRGYEVVAVDGSLVGLRYCRQALAGSALPVHLVAADLDRFPLPERRFDAIVVMRFLSRPLVRELKRALVPGGLVIYQTYNLNWLSFNPDFRREYLLEPGELAQLFADFEPIETNDTPDVQAELSYWIGRRPAG